MLEFKVSITPETVRHDLDRWWSTWQALIQDALDDIAQYGENSYLDKVNKSTGTHIRSRHLSEMFQYDVETVSGEVAAGSEYRLDLWLEHPTQRARWDKIAKKQEEGGLIRARRSRLLTVHNPPVTTPYSRARTFQNAGWVSYGGMPALVRFRESQPRGERKPAKSRKSRVPRVRAVEPKDVLFWGKEEVTLKPKRFWADTETDVFRYAGERYEQMMNEVTELAARSRGVAP